MDTKARDREFVAPLGHEGDFAQVRRFLSEAAVSQKSSCLFGGDGSSIALPEELFDILRQAASILAAGQRVHICPIDKEITTQEAADLLNVSRPYLIKLLDEGKIDFNKVGRHRRIKFGNVINYKQKRNQERARQLEALIAETREAGLYDDEYLLKEGEL